MKKIEDKNLENIIGGEVTMMTVFIVSAIVVFISGIIDGYVHPKSCNN